MTENEPTFDVVISYRRDDTQGTSSAIYRELARRFGAHRVLFDITSIPVGEDYDHYVRRIIAKAKAVIVIIGPEWLTVQKNGVRRLDQENDAVRGEVTSALDARVTIIPLLVDGAEAMEAASLPEPLRPLVRLSMMPILERYWDTDMETLAKRLAPLLGVDVDEERPRGSSKRLWIAAASIGALTAAGVAWMNFESSPSVTSTPSSEPSEAPAPDLIAPPETNVAATTQSIPIAKERRPLAITMIHESGRPRSYTALVVMNSDLNYGAGFASLKTGSLNRLLQQYSQLPGARFASQIKEYLPRVAAKDASLSLDERFRNLLVKAAGEDPAMMRLQDQIIEEGFFGPARAECKLIGIQTALGYALIADAHYQMGAGRYARIKQATIKALDGTPVTGIEEHAWLREFAKQRLEMAAQAAVPSIAQRRTQVYIGLMDANNWELQAPLAVGRFTLVDP